jgi:hypothetical protein
MLKWGGDEFAKWMAGMAVGLLPILYAPPMAMFFNAHRARASWAMGFFSTTMGFVIRLRGGIDDIKKWPAGGAVALLTILYAPPMAMFFNAYRARAERWLMTREMAPARKQRLPSFRAAWRHPVAAPGKRVKK